MLVQNCLFKIFHSDRTHVTKYIVKVLRLKDITCDTQTSVSTHNLNFHYIKIRNSYLSTQIN